jgi:hypothetical protein
MPVSLCVSLDISVPPSLRLCVSLYLSLSLASWAKICLFPSLCLGSWAKSCQDLLVARNPGPQTQDPKPRKAP